jgi:hypothetical protein
LLWNNDDQKLFTSPFGSDIDALEKGSDEKKAGSKNRSEQHHMLPVKGRTANTVDHADYHEQTKDRPDGEERDEEGDHLMMLEW